MSQHTFFGDRYLGPLNENGTIDRSWVWAISRGKPETQCQPYFEGCKTREISDDEAAKLQLEINEAIQMTLQRHFERSVAQC